MEIAFYMVQISASHLPNANQINIKLQFTTYLHIVIHTKHLGSWVTLFHDLHKIVQKKKKMRLHFLSSEYYTLMAPKKLFF